MLDNERSRSVAARVVDPVAAFLLRIGVSPNQLTLTTGLATSASALWFFSRGEFLWGLVVGLPFVVGDLLDGTMARLSGRTSAYGAFLDSVMDRISDSAIFGSLAFYFAAQGNLAAAAVTLTALIAGGVVPYIRAKAEGLGIQGKSGLMERSDRLLVVLFGLIAAAAGFEIGLIVSMSALAPLTLFTVWQRMRWVQRELGDANR